MRDGILEPFKTRESYGEANVISYRNAPIRPEHLPCTQNATTPSGRHHVSVDLVEPWKVSGVAWYQMARRGGEARLSTHSEDNLTYNGEAHAGVSPIDTCHKLWPP